MVPCDSKNKKSQEDGVAGLEEGVQFTPFNMNEEMEEGHFDANGMYHWKKEKLIRDNWLENIDWIKVKQQEEDKTAGGKDNYDDMPEAVDTLELYRKILTYLKPKETITQALKRLGGSKSLSASERLKLKKAGKSIDDLKGNQRK
uniref:Aspartyl beta-hydroxylase, putative n=1 Tax=Riptortus pedestris TaxID=329032 RepID=R4WQG1_RIPPE|nr:aspartyl beta-hydroxylase, putative [Riptortus pedestris]